jgi:zona occludens toxin (predicted ATPase)
MKKIPRRSSLALAVLVAACLALAVYVGVQGVFATQGGSDAADEAARKKAFEKAMAEGNLSFEEARYWRRLEPVEGGEPR